MKERKTDIAASVVELARQLPMPWWLLVVAITGFTNALDFFAAAGGHPKLGLGFAATALVRVLLVFWINYALLRRLAGVPAPARIGIPFFRFLLFMIVMTAVMAAATGVSTKLTGSDPRADTSALAEWLLLVAIGLALVRLYAWLAALAAGDRSLGATGAWRNLKHCHRALVLAYLAVSAVAAVHLVLTRMAFVPDASRNALLLLALVDGIVSAVQLVLGSALAVAAWRAASERARPLRETAALA